MQIIDAGEVLLAAGLEWEVSSAGVFTAGQLRSKARSHRARHYVEHIARTPAPERLYGFGTLPPAMARERRSVLSLASLVACTGPGRFAFVGALGGGAMALVGVLGGQPMPRLDRVGTEGEIQQELRNFVDAHGIGRIYFAEALGHPEFHIPGCDWVALPLDTEDRHLARIRPVRAAVGAPALIAGLVVVAGAAAVASTWYQREQALASVEQQAVPENFGPRYERARQAAFAALPNHSADELGVRMADWMLRQPIAQNGWMLHRVDCRAAPNASSPATCTASWAPGSASATFAAFGTDSPAPRFDISLHRIVTGQDLDVTGLPSLSATTPYPRLQPFLLRDGSFMQSMARLGVAVRLGTPTLVGTFTGPTVPGMIEQAPWSIHGPVHLMRALLTALPPNMAIGAIDVALTNTVPSFDAKGVLYVTAP